MEVQGNIAWACFMLQAIKVNIDNTIKQKLDLYLLSGVYSCVYVIAYTQVFGVLPGVYSCVYVIVYTQVFGVLPAAGKEAGLQWTPLSSSPAIDGVSWKVLKHQPTPDRVNNKCRKFYTCTIQCSALHDYQCMQFYCIISLQLLLYLLTCLVKTLE